MKGEDLKRILENNPFNKLEKDIDKAEIKHRIRPTIGKDRVEIVTDNDCEIVMENGKCFVVCKQPL